MDETARQVTAHLNILIESFAFTKRDQWVFTLGEKTLRAGISDYIFYCGDHNYANVQILMELFTSHNVQRVFADNWLVTQSWEGGPEDTLERLHCLAMGYFLKGRLDILLDQFMSFAPPRHSIMGTNEGDARYNLDGPTPYCIVGNLGAYATDANEDEAREWQNEFTGVPSPAETTEPDLLETYKALCLELRTFWLLGESAQVQSDGYCDVRIIIAAFRRHCPWLNLNMRSLLKAVVKFHAYGCLSLKSIKGVLMLRANWGHLHRVQPPVAFDLRTMSEMIFCLRERETEFIKEGFCVLHKDDRKFSEFIPSFFCEEFMDGETTPAPKHKKILVGWLVENGSNAFELDNNTIIVEMPFGAPSRCVLDPRGKEADAYARAVTREELVLNARQRLCFHCISKFRDNSEALRNLLCGHQFSDTPLELPGIIKIQSCDLFLVCLSAPKPVLQVNTTELRLPLKKKPDVSELSSNGHYYLGMLGIEVIEWLMLALKNSNKSYSNWSFDDTLQAFLCGRTGKASADTVAAIVGALYVTRGLGESVEWFLSHLKQDDDTIGIVSAAETQAMSRLFGNVWFSFEARELDILQLPREALNFQVNHDVDVDVAVPMLAVLVGNSALPLAFTAEATDQVLQQLFEDECATHRIVEVVQLNKECKCLLSIVLTASTFGELFRKSDLDSSLLGTEQCNQPIETFLHEVIQREQMVVIGCESNDREVQLLWPSVVVTGAELITTLAQIQSLVLQKCVEIVTTTKFSTGPAEINMKQLCGHDIKNSYDLLPPCYSRCSSCDKKDVSGFFCFVCGYVLCCTCGVLYARRESICDAIKRSLFLPGTHPTAFDLPGRDLSYVVLNSLCSCHSCNPSFVQYFLNINTGTKRVLHFRDKSGTKQVRKFSSADGSRSSINSYITGSMLTLPSSRTAANIIALGELPILAEFAPQMITASTQQSLPTTTTPALPAVVKPIEQHIQCSSEVKEVRPPAPLRSKLPNEKLRDAQFSGKSPATLHNVPEIFKSPASASPTPPIQRVGDILAATNSGIPLKGGSMKRECLPPDLMVARPEDSRNFTSININNPSHPKQKFELQLIRFGLKCSETTEKVSETTYSTTVSWFDMTGKLQRVTQTRRSKKDSVKAAYLEALRNHFPSAFREFQREYPDVLNSLEVKF